MGYKISLDQLFYINTVLLSQYSKLDEGVAMKFVGIRRVENAGQILKWKYIKSKLEFTFVL